MSPSAGSAGKKFPSRFTKSRRITRVKPFVTELMNPTGLALDREGFLYVSCRNDGTIHRVSPDGRVDAMDRRHGHRHGNRVRQQPAIFSSGDRSGTIFKISSDRQIFVFATLEPSIVGLSPGSSVPAANCSSPAPPHRVSTASTAFLPRAKSSVFFRGLGRPQGLAFDRLGNLYVAASLAGKRGIVRLTPQAEAEVVIGGNEHRGLALLPSHRALIATNNALYTLDWDVEGLALNNSTARGLRVAQRAASSCFSEITRLTPCGLRRARVSEPRCRRKLLQSVPNCSHLIAWTPIPFS